MRRHAPARQIGLYAVYLMSREAQLTDAIVDLLIETIHKIGTRSKRKVVGDIAKDIERVYGKERLLVEIASASIGEPAGRVCDVIFPIVGNINLSKPGGVDADVSRWSGVIPDTLAGASIPPTSFAERTTKREHPGI